MAAPSGFPPTAPPCRQCRLGVGGERGQACAWLPHNFGTANRALGRLWDARKEVLAQRSPVQHEG